jgi:putative ribosome biogenesis GTPase RsgA
VVPTSTVHGRGLATLRESLSCGQAAAFVGSSGVGKSSLITPASQSPNSRSPGVSMTRFRGRWSVRPGVRPL